MRVDGRERLRTCHMHVHMADPIQVDADAVSAKVAAEDAVGIQAGDDLEDEVGAKAHRPWIVRPKQQLQQAVDHVR